MKHVIEIVCGPNLTWVYPSGVARLGHLVHIQATAHGEKPEAKAHNEGNSPRYKEPYVGCNFPKL